MRLFIAVNFSDATRASLLGLRDALRRQSEQGNFSAPENLHLTLVFLGESSAKQTAAAKASLDIIEFDPFYLTIERVGRFKRNGGDIWWAGVQDNKPLQALQRKIAAELVSAGFSLDARGYSPHITLGREVATDLAPWGIKPFGETVHKIDLMKSERIGGKLTYTSIHTIGF